MQDLVISAEMAARLRSGAGIRVCDPNGVEVGFVRPRDPLAYEHACRMASELAPLSGREVMIYVKAYAKGCFS